MSGVFARSAALDRPSTVTRPPDVSRPPDVAWAAGSLFAGTADDRFEFGLAALLDGIARRAGQA